MKNDEETVSWTSEVSNQRPGIDFLPPSMNTVVESSSPPNECTPNAGNILRRPDSALSEMPTVKDPIVLNMSILKVPRQSMKRESTIEELHNTWRKMGVQALATTLSALYGKLLVVMGIAFPMSEVISTHIPHSFYEGYYLYLYFGSMAFLFYMYAMLLKGKPTMTPVNNDFNNSGSESTSERGSDNSEGDSEYYDEDNEDDEDCEAAKDVETNHWTSYHLRNRRHSVHVPLPSTFQHYGSFYLRMGAVAFGIGSMIYSGLEFGQYFELEPATKCHNVLLVLTPATRMAFIFIQMYFIFLNDEQQMRVTRHRVLAKFGLMHMIGTNLSVWLNVLVQETKHEILTFYNPEDNSIGVDKQPNHFSLFKKTWTTTTSSSSSSTAGTTTTPASTVASAMASTAMARFRRAVNAGPHHIYECRRTNIIGSLVQNASPFLFPCTIEYSLICAAILYVMWKNISRVHADAVLHRQQRKAERREDLARITHCRKSPHYYSVDCAQAHKGLFVGILFLVLTIISLILFFVLISKPELITFAVMEVNVCELSLYGMTTLATIVGMIQVRQLKFDGLRNLELDNILLVGAQTGTFIYSTFTIISGHFTEQHNTVLVLFTASASLVQTFCQTVFILDASRRSCVTPDQIRRKPGREIVTFLLVSNLAMWAINTLEKSRADSHPIQLHFYGLWAWTIITHVSMPLAIFYRFHSTVCLCEIWKRSYKIKPSYIL